MTGPGSRRRGGRPALLVTALLAAGALLAGIPGAPPATADTGTAAGAGATTTDQPLPVQVALTSVSPVSLDRTSDLTVTGVLHNTGRTALQDLQVNLRLTPDAFTRKELASWAALRPRDPNNGTLQEFVTLAAPLGPDQRQSFTVTMKGSATQLPATAAAFGPHGMAVEVVQGPTNRRLGIVRTFAVWSPVAKPPQAKLALLVPVTAGDAPLDPTGTGGVPASTWAVDSRLGHLLQAVSDPAFSYAVDPSVPAAALAAQTPATPRLSARTALEAGNGTASPTPPTGTATPSRPAPRTAPTRAVPGTSATGTATGTGAATASPSGDTGQASPGPTGQENFDPAAATAARRWLDQLRSATRGRQVVSLPYGDPDVPALAALHPDVVDQAEDVGATAGQQSLGFQLPRGLVWPQGGRADLATVQLAAAASGRVLVLPSSAVDVTGRTRGTSAAARPGPVHGRVPLPNGRAAEVLLADDTLSSAAAALGGDDATLATQRLLAETAALAATPDPTGTLEAAAAGEPAARTVLAALPRDWDPDPSVVRSSLTALKDAGWLDLTTADAARAVPAETLDLAQLEHPTGAAATRLGADHVRETAAQLDRLLAFRPALGTADAAAYWEPCRRTALELLSTAWVRHQAALGSQRVENSPAWQLADQVGGFYAGVKVIPGSAVNLITWTAPLPIYVENYLPFPLTVSLDLHPRSAQVVVREPGSQTLLPGRTAVRVTLQAKANGQTTIVGTLNAGASSGVIGVTPPIAILVHPEWQGRGLTWIGGLLALLLVVGLVRGVRRGRRRERIDPESVPDPDDVGREPVPDDDEAPDDEASGARTAGGEVPGGSALPAAPVVPAGRPARPEAAPWADAGRTHPRPPAGNSSPFALGSLGAPPLTGPIELRAVTAGGSVALTSRSDRLRVTGTVRPDVPATADGGEAPAGAPWPPATARGPAGPGGSGGPGGTGTGLLGPAPGTAAPDTLPAAAGAVTALPGTAVPAAARTGAAGGPGRGPGVGPLAGGDAGGPGGGDGGDGTGAGPDEGAGTGGRATSRLLSSSAVMAAGTLTSRVLGMLRVAVLAWAIGVGLSADTFAVANTLPNNLFVLIGGGVLNAVLVPQIVRAAQQADGGRQFVDRLVTLSVIVLGGATVLATALAPVLIRLYERGWNAEQLDLATGFALWCLPQIFFYGLYTIYGQILNARESYGPFMWAPVVNNVVAIAGCLAFIGLYGGGARPGSWWGAGPVAVLAGTATLGVVAQALVLVPALHRTGYRWHPRRGFRGMGLRTAGTVAGWTFGGVLIGQLAFLWISGLSTDAAAQAHALHRVERGRAVWDNAYLLFFLPHSLAAVSLVTAVFTRMAAAARDGRTDDVRADTSLGIRLTGLVTVPATVAFVVLGRDLARAVFFRSAQVDTDSIALVTGALVLGLVAFSLSYMIQRVFYAYEDARTPFLVQVGVVAVWAVASQVAALLLEPEWITTGLALAMSLSNIAGAALSAVLLRRRIGRLDGGRVLRSHVRFVVAALAAGVIGYVVDAGMHGLLGISRPATYLSLLVSGLALVATYGLGLRLLRVAELDLVAGPLLRRWGR